MIEIRKEEPQDFHRVFDVTTIAFGRDSEAKLVERLRDVDGYLAFVAIKDGSVVGHVSLSPVTLSSETGFFLGLAPVSVLPAVQGQGIGSRLIRTALKQCRESGAELVFVLGNPRYYARFGFRSANNYGIRSEYANSVESFMVAEIEPGSLDGKTGIVRYHPVFSGL